MCVLLVGQSVLSVTFPHGSVHRKWAKTQSALSAFQYKTEEKVIWNPVPLVFLAPCLLCIGGLCVFSHTDSCIFKMLSEWTLKIARLDRTIPAMWGLFLDFNLFKTKAVLLSVFYRAWSNGLCSSLETVPAVILPVFINSNNNKRRKLTETKDGELL